MDVLQLTCTKSDENEFTWDERPEWDQTKPYCNVRSCAGLGFVNYKASQNHWRDYHVQYFNISCCSFTCRQPAKLRRHHKLKGHVGVETRRMLNINCIPNLQHMPFRPSLRPMSLIASNSMKYAEEDTPFTQRTVARDKDMRVDYRHPNRPALIRKNPEWFSGRVSPWDPLTPPSGDLDFA